MKLFIRLRRYVKRTSDFGLTCHIPAKVSEFFVDTLESHGRSMDECVFKSRSVRLGEGIFRGDGEALYGCRSLSEGVVAVRKADLVKAELCNRQARLDGKGKAI